jgi:hypothetical protein
MAPPIWADSAVGDHEDRGDSTNYRKLAEHEIVSQQGDHGGDEQMFGAE